jgi:hypothetical protein
MRINLNIVQGTLIFGDTVTQSRHFELKLKALKNEPLIFQIQIEN